MGESHHNKRWNGDALEPQLLESWMSGIWKLSWANEERCLTTESDVKNFVVSRQVEDPSICLPNIWKEWIVNQFDGKNFAIDLMLVRTFGNLNHIFFNSTELRYCPICLASGFHSWWHQFNCHHTCLIHDCSLLSSCTKCTKPLFIGKYVGSPLAFRRAYICPSCGNPVAGTEPEADDFIDFSSIRPVLISRYAPWVCWLARVESALKETTIKYISYESTFGAPMIDHEARVKAMDIVASLCPPPERLTRSNLIACTTHVSEVRVCSLSSVSNRSKYDPCLAVISFVSCVRQNLTLMEKQQFADCSRLLNNGLRVNACEVLPEPLALWILRAYCRYNSNLLKQALSRYGGAGDHHEMVLLVAWLLSIYKRAIWTDEAGLRTIFKYLYASMVAGIRRRWGAGVPLDIELRELNRMFSELQFSFVLRDNEEPGSGTVSTLVLITEKGEDLQKCDCDYGGPPSILQDQVLL